MTCSFYKYNVVRSIIFTVVIIIIIIIIITLKEIKKKRKRKRKIIIIIIIINNNNNNNNKGTDMALNLDKTIESSLTRSHSRTLAKYSTNHDMPTVHARTWTDQRKQPGERGQTYGFSTNVRRTLSL